jgi:hypothetical protein
VHLRKVFDASKLSSRFKIDVDKRGLTARNSETSGEIVDDFEITQWRLDACLEDGRVYIGTEANREGSNIVLPLGSGQLCLTPR